MEINLSDHRPVQKKYTSVPRPLYPEVKQYIEDLLNQNFIAESKSSYSSPVVCVRKKDWTLRLCIDYRELNRDLLKEDCEDVATLPTYEIIATQQEDPTIAGALHFIQIRRRLNYQERQKEPAMVRQLLHEWNNLFVAEDGILYFKSGFRYQMVLPRKYHKRVYKDLHENMGHLGANGVIKLARQRFYGPFMRADITRSVTKVCRCLKQRKPTTHINAPL